MKLNKKVELKENIEGTSLVVVQWLGLLASSAGAEGAGSIPARGTRSYLLQLEIPHAQRSKIPCVPAKTCHSQINKYLNNKCIFKRKILSKIMM